MTNRIHNYTGHVFNIKTKGGRTISLPPEGEAYVVNNRSHTCEETVLQDGSGHRARILFRDISERGIVGLPGPQPGHLFIVSWPVARIAATSGRTDVVIGDNPIVKGGRVIAVQVLAYFEGG